MCRGRVHIVENGLACAVSDFLELGEKTSWWTRMLPVSDFDRMQALGTLRPLSLTIMNFILSATPIRHISYALHRALCC